MRRLLWSGVFIGVTILAVMHGAAASDAPAVTILNEPPSEFVSHAFWVEIPTRGLPSGDYEIRFDRYVARAQQCVERRLGSCGPLEVGRHLPLRIDKPVPAVLLRIEQRGSPALASIDVVPAARFVREREHTRITIALFCGILLAIGLSNMLIGVILRERALLIYAALMLSAAASTAFQLPDVIDRVIPAGANLLYQIVRETLFVAYVVSVVSFARAFLSMRERTPRLDRVVLGLTAVVAVIELSAAFVGPGELLGALWNLEFGLEAALFALVLAAGVAANAQGFAAARFFIVGSTGHLVGNVAWYVAPLLGFHSADIAYGFQAGIAWEGLFLAVALADRIAQANAERIAAQEREVESQRRYAEAVERFVPGEFLRALGRANIVDVRLGDHVVQKMTVLFADVRNFTQRSEAMEPSAVFAFVNGYLACIVPVLREHGWFIDKYLGDGIMALFPHAPSDAVTGAIAAQAAIARYNETLEAGGEERIRVGMGLHCGELVLGTVGERERLDTTVIADAVNIAARIEGLTKEFGVDILCSAALARELTDEALEIRSLGYASVKGKRDPLEVFAIGTRAVTSL